MGPDDPRTEQRPLLVLKGSRVREYLQQNQRLLAAPVGGLTHTRYNETWVSSRVDLAALAPGRAAVIIFSDSPYRQYCPVRHARLVAASREGSYLDLTLSIEEFVDPDAAGRDCLGDLVSAAEEVGAPIPFDDRGRKVFLDVAPAGWDIGRVPLQLPGPGGPAGPPGATSLEHSEILAWRRTIDFLVTSDEEREHYAHAFFFRPVSLRPLLDDRTEDDRLCPALAVTGPELLWPGEIDLEVDATYRLELACYNPHRTDEDVSRVRLSPDGTGRFSFPDPLRMGLPRLLREGLVELHFTPRRGGMTALELSVAPGGETSSFVRLASLRVASPDGAVPGDLDAPERAEGPSASVRKDDVGALEAPELLRLDDWIGTRLRPDPANHLQLFREFLSRWAGRDTIVAERHAALAFDQREWAEVERLLQGKDDLSQNARHQRLLASMELRRSLDVAGEAATLSWAGEFDGHFEHLLRLTPDLDADTRGRLAETLPFAIWGDDKSCRFLRALMDTPCEQDVVVYIGESLREHSALFGLDSDDVLAWLLEQARRFDRPAPDLVAQVVHWAADATRSEKVVDLLAGGVLAQLCREAGIERAGDTVRALRPYVDFSGRMRVDLSLAELQTQSSVSQACSAASSGFSPFAEALSTLMELLEEARRVGAVWEGGEVADRIRGILDTAPNLEPEMRSWAEEALEGWLAFLKARQPYRARLMDEVAQKGLEVGARFPGRTLHVFTGHQGVGSLERRYEEAGDLLGLPSEVHPLTERGRLDGLRAGQDLVVVITRWAGHPDTEAIKTGCKKANVACFLMPQHVVEPARVVLELWEQSRGK